MSAQSAGVHDALRPRLFYEVRVEDALTGLAALEPGSVDLAFADPPYNLQLDGNLYRPNQTKVDGVDAAWDQFDTFAAYDAFTREWLALTKRALKPSGTLWVIGSYHNIFRVGSAMQDAGFWILNDVVWVKTNPMPNFRGRRFTNAHETLIWAVADKDRTDYTFNYKALKTFNDDLQHRSDWVIPICIGPERLRDETGAKAHPTQKPEALVARAILAASRPGDLVLDPFTGTGTTGAVAKRLGRSFIGFEREATYAEMAAQRIAEIEPFADVATMDTEARPPRIPFGMLVEAGRVQVGDMLVAPSPRGRREPPAATVRVDGSVRSGHYVGSIHKVGAAVRGTPSCNGWTYWSLKEPDGTLTLLDALRQDMRRALA